MSHFNWPRDVIAPWWVQQSQMERASALCTGLSQKMVARIHINVPQVIYGLRSMYRSRYNVRHYHTYMDEDMIGTCKGLAKRVHRRLLELRLLGRFLLRLRSYRPKVVIKALICAGNGCWRVLTWPSKSHMWFPKKSRKFMFTNVASWGYGAI